MHALDILQQAQVVGTLSQAIADAGYVVAPHDAWESPVRPSRHPEVSLRCSWNSAASNPIALVFGREDSGLAMTNWRDVTN
jgi:tRNA (cytidine32/uridine32-2'-O)-methyltransferase